MKTTLAIQVRAFPVTLEDKITTDAIQDTIVLTKSQLQAAQLVGQSSKELIQRICSREGFQVLEIGKAERRENSLNLEDLYKLHSVAQVGKREKVGD